MTTLAEQLANIKATLDKLKEADFIKKTRTKWLQTTFISYPSPEQRTTFYYQLDDKTPKIELETRNEINQIKEQLLRQAKHKTINKAKIISLIKGLETELDTEKEFLQSIIAGYRGILTPPFREINDHTELTNFIRDLYRIEMGIRSSVGVSHLLASTIYEGLILVLLGTKDGSEEALAIQKQLTLISEINGQLGQIIEDYEQATSPLKEYIETKKQTFPSSKEQAVHRVRVKPKASATIEEGDNSFNSSGSIVISHAKPRDADNSFNSSASIVISHAKRLSRHISKLSQTYFPPSAESRLFKAPSKRHGLGDDTPKQFRATLVNTEIKEEKQENSHSLSRDNFEKQKQENQQKRLLDISEAEKTLIAALQGLPKDAQTRIKEHIGTFKSTMTEPNAIEEFLGNCTSVLDESHADSRKSIVLKAAVTFAAVALIAAVAALVSFGLVFAATWWILGPAALITSTMAAKTAAVSVASLAVPAGFFAGVSAVGQGLFIDSQTKKSEARALKTFAQDIERLTPSDLSDLESSESDLMTLTF